MLIFYSSHQGLKQNSLDLVWEVSSGFGLGYLWKILNKQGPKVSRRIINMNGLRRVKVIKVPCSHRVEYNLQCV